MNPLKQYYLYLTGRLMTWLAGLLRWAAAYPLVADQLQPLLLEKRYRLELGHPSRVVILLVGCGGSGSQTAPILAQLAGWAAGAGLDLRLYFIDPDVIETKNLVRQNFCPAEVGQPKAFSLAWRYNAAFGLNITPVIEPFQADMLDRFAPGFSVEGSLMIVVGAVDNVCARRDIAAAVTARLRRIGPHSRFRLWWLDAGNERFSGQILIGNSLEPEPQLSPLGYCTALPLPHLQEPGLLADRPPTPEPELSCAELTLREEQSAMINRTMATFLGVYLYRLLQSRDLELMATWLDLRTGTVRSQPITTGQLVKPQRRTDEETPLTPEEMELLGWDELELLPGVCPDCGAPTVMGRDLWHTVVVAVQFCTRCPWRQSGCPQCGGEIELIELETEPAVHCYECD